PWPWRLPGSRRNCRIAASVMAARAAPAFAKPHRNPQRLPLRLWPQPPEIPPDPQFRAAAQPTENIDSGSEPLHSLPLYLRARATCRGAADSLRASRARMCAVNLFIQTRYFLEGFCTSFSLVER